MVLAPAWSLAILVSLLLPGSYLPGSGWSYDKLAHFLLFAGFSGLWMVALGDRISRAYVYVIVLGIAFGMLTELGQELTPGGRHGDLLDATADGVGVIIGVLSYRVWKIWKQRYLREKRRL